jgi:hypothetical protein
VAAEDRQARATASVVWTLSLLVHALALAAMVLWEPLGKGLLIFNRADADRRKDEVKARSESLLEAQRREREKRRLDEKTSTSLKREEQVRKQRKMADDLRTLEASRRDLEKVRLEKLEQVAARTKEEVQDGEAGTLEAEARGLLTLVGQYADDPRRDKPLGEELRGQAVKINWGAGHKSGFFTPEQVRKNAVGILEQLATMEARIEAHADKEAPKLRDVSAQIERVAAVARIVAGKFDVAAYNDVSASHLRSDPPKPREPLAAADPADAYDRAVDLEGEINKIRVDIAAAEIANSQNLPFRDALDRVGKADPERPDLGNQLRNAAVDTIGDLNEYRRLLEAAKDETERMAVRAEGMAHALRGEDDPERALAKRLTNSRTWGRKLAASGGKLVDLTGYMRGGGGTGGDASAGMGDSGGGDADLTRRGSDMMAVTRASAEATLSSERVYAHSLPGRRFGPSSARKGWLYIDTWYVIGPWQRINGPDFPGAFPPQVSIDLDAEYFDGYVVPDKQLDGRLKWQFHQADSLRVQPPVVVGGSVYYAFTDVYFEAPQDMLLAIASDDAAKVWINDFVVWQDQGLSSWQMDEGFRKVYFRQGYNRVLVRFENGPASATSRC